MILDKDVLENIVQEYVRLLELIWYKHVGVIKITRQTKDWWNDKCQMKLRRYRSSKSIEDWKSFRRTVKITKRSFFNNKIQEIASKNKRP